MWPFWTPQIPISKWHTQIIPAAVKTDVSPMKLEPYCGDLSFPDLSEWSISESIGTTWKPPLWNLKNSKPLLDSLTSESFEVLSTSSRVLDWGEFDLPMQPITDPENVKSENSW
jgi:hypothetical protein